MANEHLRGHKSLAEMVSTHICVWRKALNDMMPACGPDTEVDDVLYYEHELKALADIEAACKVEMGAK